MSTPKEVYRTDRDALATSSLRERLERRADADEEEGDTDELHSVLDHARKPQKPRTLREKILAMFEKDDAK
jgi:hypothetical protein